MTQNEAQERADRIWPGVFMVERWNDAKTVQPGDVEWIVTVFASNGPAHSLDVNGHAVCHEVCRNIEAELDALPPRSVDDAEIDTAAQVDLSLDVNNPQEG